MNFSAISSSFLGHSSLFTELLLMFWYLPVSLNVNNTIFENTKRAILYQTKKKHFECDLQNQSEVRYLLTEFFSYVEPDIANFEVAVQEFKERIPELAQELLAIIEKEHKDNRKFQAAFGTFAELCRSSLDPNISKDTLNEMLIQHLLTERLFRTVFDNPDFVSRIVNDLKSPQFLP